MSVMTPTSEAEAASLIAQSHAGRTPLCLSGGGTRAGLGRPVQAASMLSTRAMTGITLYEPSEMVIGARAGTPLTEVEAALAEKGQRLPFEPMDHRALYGSQGEPTIGAVAACNVSGPRRIAQGAARDHLIGLRLINGLGETIKTGGRVMKNVTGLDLVKLSCGAFGTLGLLSEVTFKVLPATEASVTLVLEELDDSRAIAALSAGLGSPFEVTGAAHLPGMNGTVARTLLRIEGFQASVRYREGELKSLLTPFGSASLLEGPQSDTLWADIRDAKPLCQPMDRAIWRLSVAPSHGPKVIARLKSSLAFEHFYDWGGGLVWLAVETGTDAQAPAVRAALAATGGGHATLVRARDAIRSGVDVFEPLSGPLHTLSARVKASFDPGHILNPGRMVAGI